MTAPERKAAFIRGIAIHALQHHLDQAQRRRKRNKHKRINRGN